MKFNFFFIITCIFLFRFGSVFSQDRFSGSAPNKKMIGKPESWVIHHFDQPDTIAEDRKGGSIFIYGTQIPNQMGKQYNFNKPASGYYRYGFNGKEKEHEMYDLPSSSYDYGERMYDSRLGKFMSVDMLSPIFPMLSPYAFAGNSPILSIDMEGLEPEPVNPGVDILVIVVQGYEGASPSTGKTQVKNNPHARSTSGDLNDLSNLEKDHPTIKVVQYSSSEGSNTRTDVLTTIMNYKKNNPNGTVILVGHSLGADNLIQLINENEDANVDQLYTMDPRTSDVGKSTIKEIPANVIYAVNFYETNSTLGG